MSRLKFDLAQEGLHCVLKPWQAEVMRFFWKLGIPLGSRAVYDHLQTVDVKGAKSRASVINFLDFMVGEGFLDFVEESCKGGFRRVYSLNERSETETRFRYSVYQMFASKLMKFRVEAEG